MRIACSTSASASSRRPAPSARATAEEMPPPIAPADSIGIIMKPGNTSAMPASASVPRRETHQVSISPVEACAIITSTFGQAMQQQRRHDRAVQQPPRARVHLRRPGAAPGCGTGRARHQRRSCGGHGASLPVRASGCG